MAIVSVARRNTTSWAGLSCPMKSAGPLQIQVPTGHQLHTDCSCEMTEAKLVFACSLQRRRQWLQISLRRPADAADRGIDVAARLVGLPPRSDRSRPRR